MTIRTITALAHHIDADRGTVRRWIAEGLPRRADGTFDLAAVEAWCAARRRQHDDAATEGLAYWRTRREKADALSAENKLDQSRGDLMPREDHFREQYQLVDDFVTALENFPARVAPLLVAAKGYQEIDAILRDHIRAMRIQLAAKYSPPAQPE